MTALATTLAGILHRPLGPSARDALEHRLAKYVQMAGGICPTAKTGTAKKKRGRSTSGLKVCVRRPPMQIGLCKLAWCTRSWYGIGSVYEAGQ